MAPVCLRFSGPVGSPVGLINPRLLRWRRIYRGSSRPCPVDSSHRPEMFGSCGLLVPPVCPSERCVPSGFLAVAAANRVVAAGAARLIAAVVARVVAAVVAARSSARVVVLASTAAIPRTAVWVGFRAVTAEVRPPNLLPLLAAGCIGRVSRGEWVPRVLIRYSFLICAVFPLPSADC